MGDRISDLHIRSANGLSVEVRQLQKGEYVAAADYTSWSNTIDLAFPKNRTALAHASWVGGSEGILMLDDLVPLFGTRNGRLPSTIRLKLPDGWSFLSAERRDDSLFAEDIRQSIVFIGKDLRNLDVKAKSGDLRLLVSGDFHFTSDEASDMAREIFDEYSQMLGSLPKKPYQIAVKRFPGQVPHGQWEAETRGRTVTIMSSDMPFRTQSLQRLHEQLRHEIFHLWFPNGIELTGDYAWFYEGFAMYSSLKLAVKLNRIRFEDFLDTLSRAHTIDTNSKPRRALTDPGIDPTVRYARGMIVAFLTDLEVKRNSNGNHDVNKGLRTLFLDYPTVPHGSPANEAVKTVITNPAYIQRYVEGAERIDWTADLAAAGIESKQNGRTTTLTVVAKPNGRQKAILGRLGYNNWRKIGTKR